MKKRLLQAIIHTFRTTRSDRSEYFSDGDCVAATVQVRRHEWPSCFWVLLGCSTI